MESLSHDERPLKGSTNSADDEYPPMAQPFIEEGDRPIVTKPSQFLEADAFASSGIKGTIVIKSSVYIIIAM